MDWKQLQADFRQKYEGCYCKVLLEGYSKPRVFLLEHIEPTEEAPLLHLRNREFGEVILKYDDSKSDVEFTMPTIGLYNYKNTVVMVRRLYARQYKKGLCHGTIYVFPIYNTIYGGFGLANENHWSEELANVLLTPTPLLSLRAGINVLDKMLAIALSPEFAIGLSTRGNGGGHILWYYENPIGTVDPVSRKLFLREEQFKQEFDDFVATIKGADEYTLYS